MLWLVKVYAASVRLTNICLCVVGQPHIFHYTEITSFAMTVVKKSKCWCLNPVVKGLGQE